MSISEAISSLSASAPEVTVFEPFFLPPASNIARTTFTSDDPFLIFGTMTKSDDSLFVTTCATHLGSPLHLSVLADFAAETFAFLMLESSKDKLSSISFASFFSCAVFAIVGATDTESSANS